MKLKHSIYNIVTKYNDQNLIFNTKKGYLITLDNSNYDKFCDLKEITDEDTITSLKSYGFITNKENDELLELKLNHSIAKFDTKNLFLTIQTTNDCNFSCPYCYQSHEKLKLDDDKLNILKKFISNKISEGVTDIHIHWFGGEPLLNSDCILKLEEYLVELKQETNNKLKIENSITTNGYLLNKDLILKISEKTNIKSFQITIDGPKEIHDKTRKLKNDLGTFTTLINNVKDVLKTSKNIKIFLRTNLNKGNIDYIDNYLRLLHDEGLIGNERLKLHFNQTHKFDNKSHIDDDKIFFSDQKEYAQKLLGVYKLLFKYKVPVPQYSPLAYMNCQFDSINTFLISPELKLFFCSASENGPFFELGYIDNCGNVNLYSNYYKKIDRNIFSKEKCIKCKLLPLCMGGCNYLETCNHEECIPEKYIFEDLIKLYALEKENEDA